MIIKHINFPIILLCLLLSACSNKGASKTADQAANSESKVKSREVMKPMVKMGYGNESDPVTINGMSAEGHMLSIEVTYSGGCADHTFELLTDGMLMKSLPPKQFYFLKHQANGDACEALISETLQFDMSGIDRANANQLVVILSEYTGNATLTFDK